MEWYDRGFIRVDKQLRTNVPHIFRYRRYRRSADVLAHKGVHEGHVAAEVIAGKYYFDPELSRPSPIPNQKLHG